MVNASISINEYSLEKLNSSYLNKFIISTLGILAIISFFGVIYGMIFGISNLHVFLLLFGFIVPLTLVVIFDSHSQICAKCNVQMPSLSLSVDYAEAIEIKGRLIKDGIKARIHLDEKARVHCVESFCCTQCKVMRISLISSIDDVA